MSYLSAPSVESLKRAMQTYARQGGSSSIFINDDGLQILPPDKRAERLEYYNTHGIGYVPVHHIPKSLVVSSVLVASRRLVT